MKWVCSFQPQNQLPGLRWHGKNCTSGLYRGPWGASYGYTTKYVGIESDFALSTPYSVRHIALCYSVERKPRYSGLCARLDPPRCRTIHRNETKTMV